MLYGISGIPNHDISRVNSILRRYNGFSKDLKGLVLTLLALKLEYFTIPISIHDALRRQVMRNHGIPGY